MKPLTAPVENPFCLCGARLELRGDRVSWCPRHQKHVTPRYAMLEELSALDAAAFYGQLIVDEDAGLSEEQWKALMQGNWETPKP